MFFWIFFADHCQIGKVLSGQNSKPQGMGTQMDSPKTLKHNSQKMIQTQNDSRPCTTILRGVNAISNARHTVVPDLNDSDAWGRIWMSNTVTKISMPARANTGTVKPPNTEPSSATPGISVPMMVRSAKQMVSAKSM